MRNRFSRLWALASLTILATSGCVGQAQLAGNDLGLDPTQPLASGLRRLSRTEYDATLRDLLGDTTNSGFGLLPPESTDPFDNNYLEQLPSAALINAAETLAIDAAERAMANATQRALVLPCSPTGPEDAACFEKFIRTFGMRALRRPLNDEEVARYQALHAYAVEAQDFDFAVKLALSAFLQHPEMLYRVERGVEVAGRPGVYRLNAFELATRLSYFLWGSTPPDWLLEAAQTGNLSSRDQVSAAADKLLADARAQARVVRFHALWLGFHRLPHAVDLTVALQTESSALIKKVIFEDDSDYFEVFRSPRTYVNDLLATHYGLSKPAGAFAWVDSAASGRRGLLSHGAVLSAGAKFDDTSPTQRGIFVRTRLLCEDVPPPPPSANVDEPPTSAVSNCKVDRYAAHASVGDCKGCHQRLDPVGFGLEQYDRAGRYRTHDLNEPSCAISGQGTLDSVGAFQGPAQLADLLMQSGRLEQCVVTQLLRFAIGRKETFDERAQVSRLAASFAAQGHSFKDMLREVVTEETFAFRVEEKP